MRRHHPRPSRASVRLAATLLTLLAATTACGGDEPIPGAEKTPSPSASATGSTGATGANKALCAPANDYLWYLAFFTGQNGGPPQGPTQIKPLFVEMTKLSRELADQAPTQQSAAAEGAKTTWTESLAIYAKYKYADNIPKAAISELTTKVGKYQTSNQRFAQFLFDTCGGQGGSYPTKPANPVAG